MAYPAELKSGGVILTTATNINADTASDIVDISRAKHIGIDLTYTSTSSLVTNVQVEVCNDLTVESPNWQAITLDTGLTYKAISATGADAFDLTDIAFKYLRLFFDYTSGHGTARAVVHCKAA